MPEPSRQFEQGLGGAVAHPPFAVAQQGDQALTIGRSAALLAGLPRSVPGYAIDRMCAGAMTAVTTTASASGARAPSTIVTEPGGRSASWR